MKNIENNLLQARNLMFRCEDILYNKSKNQAEEVKESCHYLAGQFVLLSKMIDEIVKDCEDLEQVIEVWEDIEVIK